MPAPTFLCIGAQKCGTTWLAHAVQQHPEVATGRQKELHFFDSRDAYGKGLSWYEEQFQTGPQTRAIGEFTPNYWWTVGTETATNFLGSAGRVADAYPDLRLVVCLRDPVDRAISAYFHNLNAGRIAPSVTLLESLRDRPGIREFGNYATQLTAWLEHYPMAAFRFLVYEEEIRPDAAKPQALRGVFEHLGVDPAFVPQDTSAIRNERASDFDIRRRNATGPTRRVMERMPRRLRDSPRWAITVSESDRRALAADYLPEIERLEDLLGRDLPWDRGD